MNRAFSKASKSTSPRKPPSASAWRSNSSRSASRRLFAATSSGRIDFAISSISINNDRLKTQSFTQPYYDSDGTIVGKEGSSVKTLEDLKGKVVGVVAATTGEAWAKENAEKLGIAEVKSYAAQQDLLLDVQNGRIEGGAGELAGFQYAIQKVPGLKILVRIPTGERFAMMARRTMNSFRRSTTRFPP